MTKLHEVAWVKFVAFVNHPRFPWKLIFAFSMIGLTVWGLIQAERVARAAEVQVVEKQIVGEELQLQLIKIQDLKFRRQILTPYLERIEHELPGVSTNTVGILLEQLEKAVRTGDLVYADRLLERVDEAIGVVLTQQNEIYAAETKRLQDVLGANISEMERLLVRSDAVPINVLDELNNSTADVRSRYVLLKEWVAQTADQIKKRRVELSETQKQIVVRKSTNTLTMYEDGRAVYSMPVSLGRGNSTHEGDFSVLDKLGTVWSLWEIWLPEWMGIYNVGSAENGIHGLPFNDVGTRYWKDEVGQKDITYGCVMPDDPNMQILYDWSEVGVPVTIIE